MHTQQVDQNQGNNILTTYLVSAAGKVVPVAVTTTINAGKLPQSAVCI